ncbi:hypothetical protein SISNIDRAFT_491447 [Sistotremastrum niveocremeum HHB9708]|uniref:Secreted protein n=2 Tax=Sistotremastraceae TaxID=3402574 RepID=A0A164MSE6_9AGAM|nr:hypothetical protein SISNIDRAFT_491447 [Sistotremastrum niveocremeum HHB9708]KZT39435.1 hypothetical protein SISSUDRAFT_1061154 [Sistotremastrum suecicum HHB10207 ss-3]
MAFVKSYISSALVLFAAYHHAIHTQPNSNNDLVVFTSSQHFNEPVPSCYQCPPFISKQRPMLDSPFLTQLAASSGGQQRPCGGVGEPSCD